MVTDYVKSVLQFYSPNGTFLSEYGAFGPGLGQFYGPYSVTWLKKSNQWLIIDTYNNRIQTKTKIIGGEGTKMPFQRPNQAAEDSEGNIYVTSKSDGIIYVPINRLDSRQVMNHLRICLINSMLSNIKSNIRRGG